MNCLHCGAELVPHDTQHGAKRGAMHCYQCGCCFLADGRTPREGVPVCDQAAAPKPEPEEPAEPEPESEPEPEERPRGRRRR